MFSKRTNAIVAACLVFVASTQAVGNDSKRVGAYDFSYMTSGDLKASPVQVFDNGRNTYFQFRAGEPVPAIFAHQSGNVELLVPVHEGPYVKVASIHGQFTLQLGRSQARIIHAGGRAGAPEIKEQTSSGIALPWSGQPTRPGSRLVASLSPVAGLAAPETELEQNSYATPVKGDRVVWKDSEVHTTEHSVWFARGRHVLTADAKKQIAQLVKSSTIASRYTLFGRDDDTYKEGLETARAKALSDELLRLGVQADKITSRTGIQAKKKGNLWESNIRVETLVPTQIAKPSPAPVQDRLSENSRQNIADMVRRGVLNPEQASAILGRSSQTPTPAQTGAAVEVPPGGFTLQVSDRSIQGAIRRWGAALGYRIVWDLPPDHDAPLTGDGMVHATSLRDALEQIVQGMKSKGYAIDVTFFANRVVRFTPGSDKPLTQNALASASSSVAPAQTSAPTWHMSPSDQTVHQMLDRWGRGSEWKVVWNAEKTVPIAGEARFERPTFLAAADYVIAQAKNAGYRVKATAYANNTLVVTND